MIFCLSFKGLKIMIILAFLLFLFCVIMLLISIIKHGEHWKKTRVEKKTNLFILPSDVFCVSVSNG